MPKALWNGVVLAESTHTRLVEGHHYFPPETVKREYFRQSDTRTVCPWKGVASYYHVVVNGHENSDAVFCYPQTKPAAKNIEGHFAFWRGVQVTD